MRDHLGEDFFIGLEEIEAGLPFFLALACGDYDEVGAFNVAEIAGGLQYNVWCKISGVFQIEQEAMSLGRVDIDECKIGNGA